MSAWDIDPDSINKEMDVFGSSKRPRQGYAKYNFATQGGATGPINLGLKIPPYCALKAGMVHANTSPTSTGSATLGLGWSGATGAVLAATAISSVVNGAPVKTTLTPVTGASERQLLLTVATAPLTAGVLAIELEWFQYGA